MNDWITEDLPDFRVFGFHIPGMMVQFQLSDGSEHTGFYQGWGLFGNGAGYAWYQDTIDPLSVTAWRPTADPNGERT